MVGTRDSFVAYKITHRESGKAYIGVTTVGLLNRWNRHLLMAPLRPSALGRAILKHGPHSFSIEHIASSWSDDALLALERDLISQENTLAPQGYNLDAGGKGLFRPPPEVVAKLVASSTGRRHSEEARAKMRAAAKKRLTPEMRERIATKLRGVPTGRSPTKEMRDFLVALNESRRGVKLTDAHKTAISVAQTGMKRPSGTGEKIAATKRGKPRSPEVRAKISLSHRIRREGIEALNGRT